MVPVPPGFEWHVIKVRHTRIEGARIAYTVVFNESSGAEVGIVFPGDDTGGCKWHGTGRGIKKVA